MGPTSDATTDTGDSGNTVVTGPLDRTPQQDGVTADGHADIGEALTGTSRAGRFTRDATEFTGIWAHCRNGDFKLYNEVVQFCVQSETTNRQEMYTGGMVVDAGNVGSTAEDVFDVQKTRIGFNVLFAESVQVVRDGTDGGPAVIRTSGYDSPVAYLQGVLGAQLFNSKGYTVSTEYRLHPGARDLEIVTWIENPLDRPRTEVVGDWYAPGDRTRTFRAGKGFEATVAEFPYLTGRGDFDVAFGWSPDGGSMKIDELPFSAASPWLLLNLGPQEIPANGEYAFRRWIHVGDGRMDTVRNQILDRLDPEGVRVGKTIRVVDASGAPVAGRLVTFSQGESLELSDKTNAMGELEVRLAPETWTVQVEGVLGGTPTTTDLDFSTESVSLEAVVPTVSKLTVTAESAGAPITALCRIHGAGDGEFFVVKGTGNIDLAPGDYTITVSHGMEYTLEERQLTVVAGEDVTWDVSLDRTVDTAGWIAADFHQHTEPSTDSDVHVYDRILDNVAEGMEFVGFTDHDVVADFQVYIDELGLSDKLRTFPGVEISPTTGHVNVYPIVSDFNARGNGTITLARMVDDEVVVRIIPEIFEAAHAMPNDPLVQVNHPRGGTSLFETVNYEPDMDPTTFEHRLWSTDFDTIEIVNRVSSSCAIFADWATFQNVGLRKTGLGNSDTHRVQRGDTPGSVRNYLKIAEEPADLSEDDVKAAIKNGEVTVGMHAFLDFQDGKAAGDTITAAAGDVPFAVRVQTPEWSEITKLFVVVNGAIVQTLDRTGTNGNDFDDVINVPITEDSWVAFFAWGPRLQTSADYSGVAIAFNNPVFVDVGGDGWTAPGMRTLDLDGLNEDGWCD